MLHLNNSSEIEMESLHVIRAISQRVEEERSKQNDDTHNTLRLQFVSSLCFEYFHVSTAIQNRYLSYVLYDDRILFYSKIFQSKLHKLQLFLFFFLNDSRLIFTSKAPYTFLLTVMRNENLPNIVYPFSVHWWQKLNQRENCLCRFCVFEYKNVRG